MKIIISMPGTTIFILFNEVILASFFFDFKLKNYAYNQRFNCRKD